jgi:CRISPR-associated protein Cmr6
MSLSLHQWWTAREGRPKDRFEPHHVGLYLDRCLPLDGTVSAGMMEIVINKAGESEKPDAKKLNEKLLFASAIEALGRGKPNRLAYQPRYERWKRLHAQPGGRARRVFEVETVGRLLLHPSTGQTVTEGSVLMHHTYGIPYLPGSGLKGLAREMGRMLSEPKSDFRGDLDLLFGPERQDADQKPGATPREDRAALVDFLDALWVPSTVDSPLELDVVTPHHSSYYTQGDNVPPADWEQPVPNQRLTVGSGVRFLVVLEGVGDDSALLDPWLDLAQGLVVRALEELGFGAWTRAGYGRMKAFLPDQPRVGAVVIPDVGLAPFEGSVKWSPSSQELSAQMTNGKAARAKGSAAQAILDTLQPEEVARLKKQGNRRFEISLKESGGVPVIAGLTVPKGRS